MRGAAKAVLLALACFADTKDGRAWPGIKALSLASGLDSKTVRRALKALESGAWIHRERRRRPSGCDTSSRYTLALLKMEHMEGGRGAERTPPPTPVEPESVQEGGRESVSGGQSAPQGGAERHPMKSTERKRQEENREGRKEGTRRARERTASPPPPVDIPSPNLEAEIAEGMAKLKEAMSMPEPEPAPGRATRNRLKDYDRRVDALTGRAA